MDKVPIWRHFHSIRARVTFVVFRNALESLLCKRIFSPDNETRTGNVPSISRSMPTFPALLFRAASVMVDIDGVDWQRGNESRRGERTGLQARRLSPDIDLRESTFFIALETSYLSLVVCMSVCEAETQFYILRQHSSTVTMELWIIQFLVKYCI